LLDADGVCWNPVRRAVQRLLWDQRNQVNEVPLTSGSLTDEVLAEIAGRLGEREIHSYWIGEDGEEVPNPPARETIVVRKPDLTHGLSELAADEHIGASVYFPVVETPDGFEDAPLGLETPIPTQLLFPEGSGRVPYWYVDVEPTDSPVPRGRDLPASAMMVPHGPFPQVNIRSSRNGVSFDPQSQGFIPGGALLTSRLGRPRLRIPNMTAWVRAMAGRHGLKVRVSDAGRRAELVRARLGSREALLDLVSADNLRALRQFVRLERQPRTRNDQIVVIGLDPYLSFEAIEGCVGAETRSLIDRLVQHRLLRRGLALDCGECGRLSFVDADRIGQQFECPQCSTSNALVSDRWKRSSDEPRWFYDLYTPLRELLGAHGDIPLLASAHLRSNARSFADTPELEFFDPDTGKPVAEIDVIACADGDVVVIEAKSNGTFGGRKARAEQSMKLFKVATVLRAQKLVLATSTSDWVTSDVDHLIVRASAQAPFAPRIEVLSALGTSPG
jgi:Holliday junction resolvase-like predicted endonuclease